MQGLFQGNEFDNAAEETGGGGPQPYNRVLEDGITERITEAGAAREIESGP